MTDTSPAPADPTSPGERHLALVRRPGPRLAEGLITHIDRQPVDVELAQRQWEAYVGALHANGWRTVEVPPADDCADAVFVEDTVVVHGDLAVLTRPGAPSRRAEVDAVEQAVVAAGYRVARIEAPGTLEGGDVLKFGSTVWVGLGGRSNEEGMRQLAAHLEPAGVQVVGVPVSRVLHLKSGVTALPDGTVVGHEPLVDDLAVWAGGADPARDGGRTGHEGDGEAGFLPVPEESGAHVVLLGGDRVLMAADAPRSAQLFRERGCTVTEVDISEFIKLEGCVTCLSVRLRG
ncbi:N(G),N(G)-dimethylarginine dimethylaminohydrolase [Ornithinimicrobium sp. CNJ-824]|uniref:dimethylargininase n=1 Tax=Ornithinimicrobium sp. CNJ-824 TaxID=1904966 RepID=UPI00095978A6|nr:dimethylargininase [Ornithinimicrobium sp. CNJ-824]OLT20645.1 N(G),N(G)-dimethylarginine dimethylaminohydrolase [Ornithinimicrobium sp. CNJ-824]